MWLEKVQVRDVVRGCVDGRQRVEGWMGCEQPAGPWHIMLNKRGRQSWPFKSCACVLQRRKASWEGIRGKMAICLVGVGWGFESDAKAVMG